MRKFGAASVVLLAGWLAACSDPPKRVPHERDDSNFGEAVAAHAKTPEPAACVRAVQATFTRMAQCGLKTDDLPAAKMCEGKTGEEQALAIANGAALAGLPCDELVDRMTKGLR